MANGPAKTTFTGAVNFRASVKMVGDIMDYQAARKLRKFSDAAREVMEVGIALAPAAAEATAQGIDPAAALRTALAAKISNP